MPIAPTSPNLINTTLGVGFNSLWLHHLKAKAFRKIGQLNEAIEIWEKLANQEIEGFSEKVRSSLKSAKIEQIISHAQRQDESGQLDAAIEVLASALLNNPEQNNLEATLKRMLRKRRHKNNPKEEANHLEEHLDEIDLNQAFLIQAETRLSNNISTKPNI